jgi:uncharacterized membrane protein YbhN (UPF0104 family)
MRLRGAILAFLLLTIGYVAVLGWIDAGQQRFASIRELAALLPVMVALSALSYVARYLRWRVLLGRAGYRTSFGTGLLAYVAGFAFTATPGKVGELVRMRYLTPLGVPPPIVLGAFVFERVLDLLVVLGLAMLWIGDAGMAMVAMGFVVIFVGGVLVVATGTGWLTRVEHGLRARRLVRIARLLGGLRIGLAGCRRWLNVSDLSRSLLLGGIAWSATGASFVWLLGRLGADVSPLQAFSVFALAVLAGAASMLPGGVGSTELAIVALISGLGVPIEIAALAAVGVRLATLWFSILCGLASIAVLESRGAAPTRRHTSGIGRAPSSTPPT